MRSSLRWLLGVSVLLAALAWWWPDDVSRPVIPTGATQAPSAPSQALASAASDAPALPERLAAPALDQASFDPFIGAQPPAPPAPRPVVGPIDVPPAPPPAPPALTYRYLGQMTDPAGKQLHYLARADKDVTVGVGTQLDEGYVVEAITHDAIRLHHIALNVRVQITIPTADPSGAP